MIGSAVETHELCKRYGAITAVEDLTINIAPGEIYGFLGLNGAGKSTTIRMLLGMAKPSSGEAYLLGHRASRDSGPWARVGYLVDAGHAYPDLSVRENLEIARRLRDVADPDSVVRAIELLGITQHADQPAGVLSSGNMQRLGLAKALLHEPDLLVLDEPANALDPAGIVELRDLLRRLAYERGVAVLVSSHILAEVARMANRIGIVDRGRLLLELDVEALERRFRHRLTVDARDQAAARRAIEADGYHVLEGHDGTLELDDERAIERPDQIASLLVAAGAPPTTLHVWHEDLEDFFLRLLAEHQGVTA
jgi:ABC-2 type transport system ATP-binding protein